MSLSSHLYLGSHLDVPETVPLLEGQACAFLQCSPLKQGGVNEDSAAVLAVDSKRGVLAVADGLGGAPDGDQASQTAIRALAAAVESSLRQGTTLRESILDGFERAEREVAALGEETATTLAVIEVGPSLVRTYHTGDSEILVLSPSGEIKWRTLPHSPIGYAVEGGLIDANEAMFSEHRHLISSVIGGGQLKVEVSGAIPFEPGDTALVCSDGLFDNLFVDEVVTALQEPDLLEATSRLVRFVHRRMTEMQADLPCKPDDLAVLGYRTAVSGAERPEG